MSRIVEEAESIVAGEASAMQLNPDFNDLCVLGTYRIKQLTAMVDEFVATVEEVCRIIEEAQGGH